MRRLICLMLVLGILAGSVFAAGNAGSYRAAAERAVNAMKKEYGLRSGAALLGKESPLRPGDAVSDWIAMDLALLGISDDYDAYLDGLRDYVEAAYRTPALLDPYRATQWHRIALTVLSLGGDPCSFGTKADGSPIDLVADGTYAYVNGDVGLQGLNGVIYALMVLDAVPQKNDLMESAAAGYLARILESQGENGGFGLTAGSEEVDLTAMALQALSSHREDPAVQDAIDRALSYLDRIQAPDGTFDLSATCEGSAQVVAALAMLDMDPQGDRFRKPQGTAMDGLLSFQTEQGSFAHTRDGKADAMALSQSLFALAACARRSEQGVSVFDFSNYQLPSTQKSNFPFLAVGAAAAAVLIVVFFVRRRKN